jgi:hypothetical protein
MHHTRHMHSIAPFFCLKTCGVEQLILNDGQLVNSSSVSLPVIWYRETDTTKQAILDVEINPQNPI